MRAMWLLAGLRLRRLANMLVSARMRPKAGAAQAGRTATPGKRGRGVLLGILVVSAMLFSFGNMARQSVINMQCEVGQYSDCYVEDGDGGRTQDVRMAEHELATFGFSAPVSRALGMQLSLLFVVSLLLPLGSRELASAEWDLEWLVTLPVKRTTLLGARLFERTLVNPAGWIALGPSCVMVAWFAGYRWGALPFGLAIVLLLLPITAVLRTIVDTGLRIKLAPSQLRNLQAVCGVATLPFMYLAMGFGMPGASPYALALAKAAPTWVQWTPPGLAIKALGAKHPGPMESALDLLMLELIVCVALGMLVLRHQLRRGVVASGAREAARKPAGEGVKEAAPEGTWLRRLLPRSPVQRRELRLLARDRNFLVQSLLMPVVIVVGQALFNGQLESLGHLARNPQALAVTAFGIGSYMLLLSALQTLNNEGQVLWMLYTFPRSIESVLKDKARMWGALALAYPLTVLVIGFCLAPRLDWLGVSRALIALAGIPVYAVIAVALGVFACDPLAQDMRAKVRPTYIYLYMLLASLYAYAIYAAQWWQTLVVMVLTACLAQALWQKARDALPYLLDPAAAPPSRVSTADGMIAAMLFFVLQGVILILMTMGGKSDIGRAIVIAFAIAGAVVYALTRLVFWKNKTQGVPVLLGGPLMTALGAGLGAGALAAVAGIGYLHLVRLTSFAGQLEAANPLGQIGVGWLIALAVIAAPLFEEFIFRGLVFGGLRRSMSVLPAAVLSAALFAIVHPPISMLPVFVLGLCTAWSCQRSKGLLAPMLTHALYNAVVLSFQLLFASSGAR